MGNPGFFAGGGADRPSPGGNRLSRFAGQGGAGRVY